MHVRRKDRPAFSPRSGTPPDPQIIWRDGNPESALFGDIYATRAGALAQARAVFLAGCDLPHAWAGRRSFTLLELGFGAGINFLATLDLWRSHRPPGAILHYLAIEGFPMNAAEARRIHTAEPELGELPGLTELSESLLRRWPAQCHGLQRLWYAAEGLCLSLMIAPALEALATLAASDPASDPAGETEPPEARFRADAVFLDGFSPSKNPEMWSPALLSMIAALCAADARVASYSVAGHVRRALSETGFEPLRAKGLATKKQRLVARRAIPSSPRKATEPAPDSPPARAIVIGGGIAGACAAFAFALRGVHVTVFDALAEPGASFNPAALMHPRLDAIDSPARRLHLAGFLYARDLYLEIGKDAYEETGICVQPGHPDEALRFAKLAAAPPLGPEWLNFGDGAILHRRCGAVRPPILLPALLANAIIHRSRPIGSIMRMDGEWRAFAPDGTLCASAPLLVLAPGARGHALTDDLPVDRIAGQVDWAEWSGEGLSFPPAGERYAVALDARTLMFGATFDRLPAGSGDLAATSAEASARNRDGLMKVAPILAAGLGKHLGARAGIRAAFADQLPAFGFLDESGTNFSEKNHGGAIIAGLGSRGFTLAPLLAEAAVSLLLGEPSPLEPVVLAALSPLRFAARARRKYPPGTN